MRQPYADGESVRDTLDTTELRVRAACGGTGACGACVVRLIGGMANPPTPAEYQKLTADERERGIRLACQLRPTGDVEIELELHAPPSAWKSIPPQDLAPSLGSLPTLAQNIYGLAVDLGTTHIRLALWDRKRGHRIASRRGPNPQSAFGADVLNRLSAALNRPQQAAELAKLARTAIVQAVRDILARDVGEVMPMLRQIGHVIVVGNTAMLALLTGRGIGELLVPDNWERAVAVEPDDVPAFQAGWFMPNAVVSVAAPLAGFVGSDLLADLAATRFGLADAPELLVDVGTNTEIALWDGQRLHVTSVPGGPAFEGSGLCHGMAAEAGAISQVRLSDGLSVCTVIGGGEARGFCGSGLVDAVAVLRETGALKPSGRFAEPPGPEGHCLVPDNPRSALTSADIDTFQRAKAATGAAMLELAQRGELDWHDLRRVCVCGAFGHTLDIGNAQAIGLLPPVPKERIELIADASLAGCERALLSPVGTLELQRLADSTHLINLSLSASYDNNYIDQLRLIPIPNVQKRATA